MLAHHWAHLGVVSPVVHPTQRVPVCDAVDELIDGAPSRTSVPMGRPSVPMGRAPDGSLHWMDIQRDALHIGIFGGTGAGKDNLIENWFLSLVKRNSPEQVQFAVLDGKGHWLKPMLSNLSFMWLPPAGGVGDEG